MSPGIGFDGLPALRDVIQKHGLAAKKNLGQNFILDLNLTAKIASLAGSVQDRLVVEIGPGPGGLTRGLLLEGGTISLQSESHPIEFRTVELRRLNEADH